MRQDAAETLALQALAWLVGQDELLPIFLGASGSDLTDLRAQAGDAALQIAVLDFLMLDDAWVGAFCDAHGLAYDLPMRARQALPGGALPHWT